MPNPFKLCCLLVLVHVISIAATLDVQDGVGTSLGLVTELSLEDSQQSGASISSNRRLLAFVCRGTDISISQSQTGYTSTGIPKFTVNIVNLCYNIHLYCGSFASAVLVNPNTFRRIAVNDCLVMRTVVTTLATQANQNIYYTMTPFTALNNSYLINIFLAELQTLTASQSRVFDILVNGVIVEPGVNVYTSAQNAFFEPIEIYDMDTVDADGKLNITLALASNSSLPPIWIALEVFSVHDKSAGTLASDGTNSSFSSFKHSLS